MFGDDDHSHPVLAFLTLLNTVVLLAVLYALLFAGALDLRRLPIIGKSLPGPSQDLATADDLTPVPTPYALPRATSTRGLLASASLATPSPTPSGFHGGDAVLLRRGAEFRSSPDLKDTPFCSLRDETPGMILRQDPARSTDQSGRSRQVYPVEVRDGQCAGGSSGDIKGWVPEEALRHP